MTFDEARQRSDYNFALNGIESDIEDIRNNYMKRLYENGDPERGIAILEIGYVDIEVNLMTCNDYLEMVDLKQNILEKQGHLGLYHKTANQQINQLIKMDY